MLLILLIMFLVILCFIERELDGQDRQPESGQENCHKCSTEVTIDQLICSDCGSLLREHCHACGHSKVVSHQYCPWCGELSASRSQYAA